VWLPQVIADIDQVHPGDRVSLFLVGRRRVHVHVRVAGVYEPLNTEAPRGYWRHWYDEIFQSGNRSSPPPQFILVGQDRFIRLSQRLGLRWADFDWQAPLAPGVHPTLNRQRSWPTGSIGSRPRPRERGAIAGTTRRCADTTFGRPVWSPDGAEIAFARLVDGEPQLWVMWADGSDPHLVAELPSYGISPLAWQPVLRMHRRPSRA